MKPATPKRPSSMHREASNWRNNDWRNNGGGDDLIIPEPVIGAPSPSMAIVPYRPPPAPMIKRPSRLRRAAKAITPKTAAAFDKTHVMTVGASVAASILGGIAATELPAKYRDVVTGTVGVLGHIGSAMLTGPGQVLASGLGAVGTALAAEGATLARRERRAAEEATRRAQDLATMRAILAPAAPAAPIALPAATPAPVSTAAPPTPTAPRNAYAYDWPVAYAAVERADAEEPRNGYVDSYVPYEIELSPG